MFNIDLHHYRELTEIKTYVATKKVDWFKFELVDKDGKPLWLTASWSN